MERGEKTEIVLEYLYAGINSGKWGSGLLPKELDIARELSVSRWAVRNAFDHLVAENVVKRKKRFGTVIQSEYINHKRIGSVLRTSGDFYEDIFKYLNDKITSQGDRMQFVNVSGFDSPHNRRHIFRSIKSLVDNCGDKLILDGYVFHKFPLLGELLKKSPVFFDYIDGKIPKNATGVFIDYYEIGKIAAGHLLAQGCKHPLYINIDGCTARVRNTPEIYAHHRTKRIFDGYSDVLRQNGMDPFLYTYTAQFLKKQTADDIYEIFSHPDSQPDGIFANSDFSIINLLKIARDCNFVPQTIIGVFDTPWSRGKEPGTHFSSIAVSAEKCAEALQKLILTPADLRKDIYIKPFLRS